MLSREICFKTIGARRLSLLLRTPDTASAPLPVMVGITGGGWSSCVKTDFLDFVEPLPTLALEAGFAVASLEYRIAPEAELSQILSDVMDGIRYLVAHAKELNLDVSRMGICGHSAGAHLALMASVAPQALFTADSPYPDVRYSAKCCMAFAPPTVLFDEPGAPTPQGFGFAAAFPGKLEDDAYRRLLSPITHVKKTSPRTLLVHGDSDPAVYFGNSLRYLAAARAVGADCGLYIVSGGGHCFETVDALFPADKTTAQVYTRAAEFLIQSIKG